MSARSVPRSAIALAALAFVVPLFAVELFPFTAAPMFRDDLRTYCVYTVRGAELEPLGLHIRWIGNPEGRGTGIASPAPLHPFGEVPEPDWLVPRIAAKLPVGGTVEVTQTVFGPRDDGSFGQTDERRFTVAR